MLKNKELEEAINKFKLVAIAVLILTIGAVLGYIVKDNSSELSKINPKVYYVVYDVYADSVYENVCSGVKANSYKDALEKVKKIEKIRLNADSIIEKKIYEE